MLLKKIRYFINIIKRSKISIKLTVVYAVMFSAVLLLLNASILLGVRYYLYNQANKQIEDMQTIILNKLTSQNDTIDLSSKELFSDIPSKENMSLRIITEDGKILNSTQGFDFHIEKPHNNVEKHMEDKERHILYKNVAYQWKINVPVYIQIVKDMHSEYEFMKILFWVMAIADFIGVIASIIIGYILSNRMLKPIDDITKTAERISINNLKDRIETGNRPDDELKRLADAFNKMTDRLQESFDRQVQFVSDASHELKTPVAVIQGYANLLDRWGKDDKDALEKSIYAIKLETANMAELIEKLLFLAKGDSGTQLIDKKEIWLNELIDEVAKESRLIAPDHIITSNKNDRVSILADYKMLKQMLRIFIGNSVKFAPEQSIIDISSELNEDKVRITVSDVGMGIPVDEIEKIFDRFYTVDKSRSKEKSGTGLGLSIAKWIVDMHGGTLRVESEEDKYTKMIVELNIDK